MENNIINEAIADMKKIKEEAEKLAKEKLAGSMSELYENYISEELKKKTEKMSKMKDSMKEEEEMEETNQDNFETMEEENLDNFETMEEENLEIDDVELEMDLTEASMEEIEKIFSQSDDETDIEVVKDDEMIGNLDSELDEYNETESIDSELDEYNETESIDSELDEYDDSDLNLDDFNIDEIDIDEMEGADEPVADDSIVNEEEYEEEEENMDETSGHGQSYDKRRAVGNAYQQHLKYAKERMRPAVQDTISEKYNNLLNKNKELVKKLNESMNTQKKLYSANKKLNEAVKEIKDQLYDLSVFNTNLSHVNKLFVEHSTTLDEKKEIVKRFKNSKTIEESKKVFGDLIQKLSSKKPIEETVKEKSEKVIDSSTKNNIVETTAYDVNDNPHLKRIKDVINRMDKRK
ncbi:MAG: hypothetical protein ACOC33_02240 [bacterium]